MAAQLTKIREGSAQLFVPKESFRDPFSADVFYNPAMSFSRSVSSLATGCALEAAGIENATVVDGLCSLGARGIRYACENNNVGKVFFVDANPLAVKALKKNVVANGLKPKSQVFNGDLNEFLVSSKTQFDCIEIDPFGSPATFLENSVRRLGKKAVISVTATDLAALCGVHQNPCLRHYSSKPLRCEYAHEIAMRILLGAVSRVAARFERGFEPMVSWYQRHYVKTIALIEDGAREADETFGKQGFVSHCFKCFNRLAGELPVEECPACGSKMDYAGPLWIGEACDESFLEKAIERNETNADGDKARVSYLLSTLKKENFLPPGFFDLHAMARLTKKTPPLLKVVEILRKRGFNAEATHFDRNALKTDADAKEVLKAIAKA
jgi:tRNA (guanine26-N2/guanine27-N2)-dimethyltransferase